MLQRINFKHAGFEGQDSVAIYQVQAHTANREILENLNAAVIRNEQKEIKCNKHKTKLLLNGHPGQPAQHRVNCGEFEGGGGTKVSGGDKLGNRGRRVGDFRLLNLQQHFVL